MTNELLDPKFSTARSAGCASFESELSPVARTCEPFWLHSSLVTLLPLMPEATGRLCCHGEATGTSHWNVSAALSICGRKCLRFGELMGVRLRIEVRLRSQLQAFTALAMGGCWLSWNTYRSPQAQRSMRPAYNGICRSLSNGSSRADRVIITTYARSPPRCQKGDSWLAINCYASSN